MKLTPCVGIGAATLIVAFLVASIESSSADPRNRIYYRPSNSDELAIRNRDNPPEKLKSFDSASRAPRLFKPGNLVFGRRSNPYLTKLEGGVTRREEIYSNAMFVHLARERGGTVVLKRGHGMFPMPK